ncbi:hypothetical protein KBB08_01510, partial [Candidatus Gracilibacteria bacterium]|nr:hypothetical protein [Candidatus Gracilibacteria bacterium]
RNGNRVGDWTTPLMFTTDAGTLRIVGGSEAASASKSVSADRGRGQITLIASTTAATATVTCKSGTLQGTTQVVFSADAPGVRNGFGSAQIAGVGELQVRATDDHIVASFESVPSGASQAGTINATPINGFATIESFVYDDSGDPTCGDRLIYSIQSGNGNLQLAVPTATASTAVRSLILDGTSATCLNGRYVAHLNLLNAQTAGDVVVKVTDTSTSPSLMTTVTIRVDVVRLEATVYDNNILTRNTVQVGNDEATASNVAPVIIKTLDENNDPFLTSDLNATGRDDADEDDIECRIVSGAAAGARLEGTNTAGNPLRASTVFARYIEGSAGLYVLNVVAGTASGTLNVECRDVDAITQPAVQFSVNVRNPEVEMFVSSREAREGTLSTIMARVRDGSKPVTGEQIRLQIGGGDGSVDSIEGTGYDRSEASNNSVNMDHICFEIAPVGTSSSNNLFSYSNVVIREYDDPCNTGGTPREVDSGWYTAKLFMPESTERDQTIALTATDLSRVEQPRDDADVIVTTANIGDAQTMEVMPISDEVGVNQDVGTVIFVQDDSGYGLHCSASTTAVANGESSGASGCDTATRNGYVESDLGDTISINMTLPFAGTAAALSVSPTNSENVNIYSGGTGAIDTANHRIIHNLGGGAYFMAVRAKDRADRGEWDFDLNDASGDTLDSQLAQLNIVPNSIDAEFNLETTMPDWNNTLIAFVSDQNDDPVTTLNHCDIGSSESNFTDFALTRAGSEVEILEDQDASTISTPFGVCSSDDGTSLLNISGASAGLVGTGLYLFNADTVANVSVGTVTVNMSLNQATNPDTSASYRVVDPTVAFDAWPTHMGTSNIVPLTVIVRDDNGDPITFATGTPVQVEITNGSGQLAATNAATVTGSLLRVDLTNTTNGVFAGAFKASSVRGNVDLVARINAISNRAEDSLTLSVH